MTPIILDNAQPAGAQSDMRWRVLFWVGLGLAVIGFTDIAFIWVPFDFNNATWRMRTITATIDSLPLATIATAMMFAVSASEDVGGELGVVALLSTVVSVALIALVLLYGQMALGGGSAIQSFSPSVLARTVIFGVLYVIIYILLAIAAMMRLHERQPTLSPRN